MWRVPRFGKGERRLKAGKDYRAAELESAGEGGGREDRRWYVHRIGIVGTLAPNGTPR